jgi:hypothetical protein
MIVNEYKVLNIKTGKIIVMNDNSIKALKKHNLWHGFDILEQPKKIEPIIQQPTPQPIVEPTIVVETIIDESTNETESKPKRKYTKK